MDRFELVSSSSSAYRDSPLCTCLAGSREEKTSAYVRRCVFRELMQCVCSPGLCLRRATDVAFPFQPLHLLPLCCPGRFCLRSAIQTMPATVTASIKATAVFPICEEWSPFARSTLCKKEHTLATGGGGNLYTGKLFFCLNIATSLFLPVVKAKISVCVADSAGRRH